MKGRLDRREFLQSVSATGSLLVCYGVLDRSADAAPVRITPPVVDNLTIQVVLDTNHDIFISGAQAPGVGVKRIRSPAAFNGRTLESQRGLSLHLTSTKGTDTKRILLDFGYTPDVLNNNLELLGIEAGQILTAGTQDLFRQMAASSQSAFAETMSAFQALARRRGLSSRPASPALPQPGQCPRAAGSSRRASISSRRLRLR